jgi:hypothetical protein
LHAGYWKEIIVMVPYNENDPPYYNEENNYEDKHIVTL